MLYNLLYPLADSFGPFNLFRYLTFRTGGAVLTALLVIFIFGPAAIRWLRSKQGNGRSCCERCSPMPRPLHSQEEVQKTCQTKQRRMMCQQQIAEQSQSR